MGSAEGLPLRAVEPCGYFLPTAAGGCRPLQSRERRLGAIGFKIARGRRQARRMSGLSSFSQLSRLSL